MIGAAIQAIRIKAFHKSVRLVAPLEDKIRTLLLGWTIAVSLVCLARILSPVTPADGLSSAMILIVPHMLILASPFFAYWAANSLIPRGTDFAQPEIRLSRLGSWRAMDALSVRRHPAFGPVGIMASLLIGMLLNVPVRTAEFMAAVPAMTGSAPIWGQMIYFAMATDLIAMNFLYTFCFFMALRRMPFFPRMLLLTWGLDVVSQLLCAQFVSGAPGLPPQVAAAIVLLLESNLQKAFISIAVWMPYLILSERVNVTYRWRQPA